MKRNKKDLKEGKQFSKKWKKVHSSYFATKMKAWKKDNHKRQRALEAQQFANYEKTENEDVIHSVKKQSAGDLADSPVDWW